MTLQKVLAKSPEQASESLKNDAADQAAFDFFFERDILPHIEKVEDWHVGATKTECPKHTRNLLQKLRFDVALFISNVRAFPLVGEAGRIRELLSQTLRMIGQLEKSGTAVITGYDPKIFHVIASHSTEKTLQQVGRMVAIALQMRHQVLATSKHSFSRRHCLAYDIEFALIPRTVTQVETIDEYKQWLKQLLDSIIRFCDEKMHEQAFQSLEKLAQHIRDLPVSQTTAEIKRFGILGISILIGQSKVLYQRIKPSLTVVGSGAEDSPSLVVVQYHYARPPRHGATEHRRIMNLSPDMKKILKRADLLLSMPDLDDRYNALGQLKQEFIRAYVLANMELCIIERSSTEGAFWASGKVMKELSPNFLGWTTLFCAKIDQSSGKNVIVKLHCYEMINSKMTPRAESVFKFYNCPPDQLEYGRFGGGSFATAVKGFRLKDGERRPVAIKKLDGSGLKVFKSIPRVGRDVRFPEVDAKNELKLLLKLNESGVTLRYYDQIDTWGQDGRRTLYIIQEPLRGPTVRTFVKGVNCQKNLQYVQKATEIIGKICTSIGVLHSYGVYHLDLKPEHVCIFDQYTLPKFIDFGFATCEKKSVISFGTIGYMEPQSFLKGHRSYEHPTDLADYFAIGMILLYLMDRNVHDTLLKAQVVAKEEGLEIDGVQREFDKFNVKRDQFFLDASNPFPREIKALVSGLLDLCPDRRKVAMEEFRAIKDSDSARARG